MAELKLTIDANKALRDRVEVRTAERDAAVAHLRAVLDWSNTERFAGRTRHENDAPSSARSFLDGLDELQTSPKTSKDLDLCDECGCIGLCDPRCSLVPVQQDEPEGVCAFPNCSCTENRCPAKGERGPFCDHGFHPRLCGRCAPVPEAVTDEDEVQCQMCKTVQPRPDKECGHCGAGPKYLCPIHTRPAAVPVQQERSVRAPKTDDPHSLPRVDDLLDDIPVQQEPGRYSDRERVADYLASAQGVEFHDLNDDAQREWLMRASDALRAVWSIGRLVDADDGYEVMCEPVAAMVEDVRAALVPVQQDEPEGVCAFPNCSCTENRCPGVGGEPCRGCGVPTGVGAYHHIGCRTPEPNPVPVQQESDLRALRRREASFGTSRTDLPITPEPEDDDHVPSVGLRDRLAEALWNAEENQIVRERPVPWAEINGRDCQDREWMYDKADAILSVLHEAGTQGDCEHCATRRKDDESLRRRVRERLARIDQDDIEGGYSVVEMATDLERLARVQLSGLCVRDGCRAGDLPAEAGTQEDEGEAFKSGYRAALIDCREALDSPKLALKWLEGRLVTFAPAPAVSGTPDTGQRQRREMFDTFAPTEPTVDDLQRSPAEAGTQEDET